MTKKKTKTPEQTPNKITVSTQPDPVVEASLISESTKIWNEIKEVQLNMFSLPDQTVEKYCKPITIEPSKLYVTIKVSSVLTSLEDALGKKFEFHPNGKYVMIVRKK